MDYNKAWEISVKTQFEDLRDSSLGLRLEFHICHGMAPQTQAKAILTSQAMRRPWAPLVWPSNKILNETKAHATLRSDPDFGTCQFNNHLKCHAWVLLFWVHLSCVVIARLFTFYIACIFILYVKFQEDEKWKRRNENDLPSKYKKRATWSN